MMYALHLYSDNRIHSAGEVLPNRDYGDVPIVDYLPDGNIRDYRYVLDENLDTGELSWEYEYDPLPVVPVEPDEPVETEATADEVLNALLGV